MPEILHRIGIRSTSAEETYEALTTCEGLSAWWTSATQGESKPGGVIEFRLGERGGFDIKVLELQPAQRVLWQVVEGPEAWVGTRISFELRQVGDFTVVLFKHQGWKAPEEFMHHCSTKWALFLMSLKALVETGKGAPWPNDVQISDWH